ncbi:biopolymer transporter ExbD [Steroidobacter denitrificans]|uniref:Biopolymer transporter ExbD n=1 Tax=Steroidobacter denitrificans TaxID=465721 RepID=A0A127F8E9_STEDE|nr:biopolymer transporter ExbD [Steroidobacter denitrificans]AMN46713.1 biopolymer transporter ExbD [Steroidobacter denitrificans]
MSSSSFLNTALEDEVEERAMSEINTTPLVDVMLVLLIVFMITVPVITQTVPVNLPKVENIPTETKPENITIAVNSQGQIFWNLTLVNDEQLLEHFDRIARLQPQPEVHVRADQHTRYEYVGRVIVNAQRKGIMKVGFITEPEGRAQ